MKSRSPRANPQPPLLDGGQPLTRNLAITALIAAVVGMLAAGLLVMRESGTIGPISVTGEALIGGPFELIDHTGRTVTDRSFSGQYMLVYFGFTHCPDICPASLQTMTSALEELGPRADRITPIFITADPERDTQDLMASYVSSFHPRLIGLTGSEEAVTSAVRTYRVYARKVYQDGSKTDYTVDHSSFFYLMGPDGRFITHFNHNMDAKTLSVRLGERVGS